MAEPKRVALTALGCKVNFAEMAELAGTLAAAGMEVVPEHEHADIRVLNSCTVTLQADATTRQRLRRLRRYDPAAHIVLTGCSVDANPEQYLRRDDAGAALLPPDVDAVFANPDKLTIADHLLQLRTAPAETAGAATGRARAFIKVQDGCDHRCTYCIVWKARGAARSVPAETVLERVRGAVERGHAEVVLCGVDLGWYGRDCGLRLHDLVAAVLDALPAGTRLRLSSINANDITPQLAALNARASLCSHWHLPLQSGSDHVLKAMHRGYRRRQFMRVVQWLRDADPLTEFTSDVMVAFPGETQDDHSQTLRLIEEVGFLECHVFRWSPRPGTPATAIEGRVDDATARRRSAEARRRALATGAASLARAAGREHEVVWDHIEEGTAHGIAATYHEVVVDANVSLGAMDRVLATGVEGRQLRGRLLRDE